MAIAHNPDVRGILDELAKDPLYVEAMRVQFFAVSEAFLAIVALSLFAESTFAFTQGLVPLWAAMTCNLMAVYLAFSPLLAASQQAISSSAWLNDLIGLAAGQLLLAGINMTALRALGVYYDCFTGQTGEGSKNVFVPPPPSSGSGPSHIPMMITVSATYLAFLMSPWCREFFLLYMVPQSLGLARVAYKLRRSSIQAC